MRFGHSLRCDRYIPSIRAYTGWRGRRHGVWLDNGGEDSRVRGNDEGGAGETNGGAGVTSELAGSGFLFDFGIALRLPTGWIAVAIFQRRGLLWAGAPDAGYMAVGDNTTTRLIFFRNEEEATLMSLWEATSCPCPGRSDDGGAPVCRAWEGAFWGPSL